jgi:uncharacterized oxidoreductase
MNLEGRTIVITGAGRGIGRELTRQSIELGARVVAVGRDSGRLASLTAAYGDRVATWAADLGLPEDVDRLVRDLPVRHPAVSIVINNAGLQTLTDFMTDDLDALRPVLREEIAVNLDAVVALSTGLLPHLRRQPSAGIVNITTALAIAPKRSAPVYCATKAGVRAFTRALGYQCADAAPHVQVFDAVMALVDTDMTRGRGRGKLSPAAAASAVLAGLRADTAEIYVGRARLLRTLMRFHPALGYRILRDA